MRSTVPWRDRRRFAKAWGRFVGPVRETIAGAETAEWFLHPAKAGGSTVQYSLRNTPGWTTVRIPEQVHPADADLFDEPDPERTRGTRCVISLGHAEIRYARWWRSRTAGVGGDRIPLFMTVRPARARTVSVFTDYWAQVAAAEDDLAGRADGGEHRSRRLAGYLADAAHYRDADGRIDGPTWFRSFAEHGPGMPFLLHEIFHDDPDDLRRLLDDGTLVVVPTSGIDAFLAARGVTATRRRTSPNVTDPAITTAITEAADLIDAIAARDAAFDRIVADHLGDPGFAGT